MRLDTNQRFFDGANFFYQEGALTCSYLWVLKPAIGID